MHRCFLFIAFLGHVALALGQSLAEPSPAWESLLPRCAGTCLNSSIPASPCAPTNLACLCGDHNFAAILEACVTTTCTIKEQLITKNSTATACGVEPRDRSRTLYVLTVTLGVITAVVVLLRLGFRAFVSKINLAADDWAVVGSLVIGLPGTIMICVGTIPNGVGRDVWTLTFDQITRFGLWFFLSEIQYFTNIAAVKLSLLLFYLRIFPSHTMRVLLWGTIAFDVLFGAGFVVASVVQCFPVDHFWHKWDGEHRGHCINTNAVGWANALISIALDFWMLALPLSQLRSLRLHWKKKLAVAVMFVVGTFVTVVSIFRLQALLIFSNSRNLTYDNFDVHLWSTIELNVAIICACLPTMRQMLVWLCPVIFSGASSTLRSGGGCYSNNCYSNNYYGSDEAAAPSTPSPPKIHLLLPSHHHHHHHQQRPYRYDSKSNAWRPAPHDNQQQQQQQQLQTGSGENRVALARSATVNTVSARPGQRDFGGRIGVQEIRVQRSFDFQDEESPGSPVQMTEFVSARKLDTRFAPPRHQSREAEPMTFATKR